MQTHWTRWAALAFILLTSGSSGVEEHRTIAFHTLRQVLFAVFIQVLKCSLLKLLKLLWKSCYLARTTTLTPSALSQHCSSRQMWLLPSQWAAAQTNKTREKCVLQTEKIRFLALSVDRGLDLMLLKVFCDQDDSMTLWIMASSRVWLV